MGTEMPGPARTAAAHNAAAALLALAAALRPQIRGQTITGGPEVC